jgi:tRNA (cmo5U34)-methyltransferase
MREVFPDATFAQFYQAVAAPIEPTGEPLQILDLGCGTGLEIEALLQRAPNALITGVDLSTEMLERLRERYSGHLHQITTVMDSYLTMPFGAQGYDYIVSAMTVHHLLREPKRKLYEKIHAALKPGGRYIEGDSVTPAQIESQFRAEYDQQLDGLPQVEAGEYHIDIPFSLDTQQMLLLEAGFRDFEVIWQKDSAAIWNAAVYVVTK